MASVDLTDLKVSADAINPFDFGGIQDSALGAARLRIERQGECYSLPVTTAPMPIEPDGRRWAARLLRARKLGGIVRLHQPGFNSGAPGSPVMASNTALGRVLPLTGLTPYYAIREGQALNYIIDGQRYLDFAAEEVVAGPSGLAAVTLINLIRAPLSAGDTIDLETPCIEGWITGDFSIPRPTNRLTQFSFTITEKE